MPVRRVSCQTTDVDTIALINNADGGRNLRQS